MRTSVRGSVLLLLYGGVASTALVWHGPTSLIWRRCPELVPGHSFGSNTSTAAQCQALATLHGANALNYNTDPSKSSGARCQLRNCSSPVAPAWKVPFWVGYATFAVPPPPPPAPPKPGQLSRVTLMEAAARDGAVCLDGSPPVYYWRAGSGNGAKSWVLFLEGGGWCAGLGTAVGGFDSCLKRSKGGLGSSHGYGPTMSLGEGSALWSADPRVNPRFWNWNVAYAKYCDGASFSGNASLPANASGSPLYFRGARILAAIVANITAPTTMGGKGMVPGGSDGAILSGCSAGGLATYLHCDAFAELVAPTPTKCVADAGYFANIPSAFGRPKIPNPRGSIIEYEYTWVFTNQQSNNSHIGVNQNCLAALGHDNPLCFFPEYSLQHMTTPMFVLQSGYVRAPPCKCICICAFHCRAGLLV
jgi:hypothetical protein